MEQPNRPEHVNIPEAIVPGFYKPHKIRRSDGPTPVDEKRFYVQLYDYGVILEHLGKIVSPIRQRRDGGLDFITMRTRPTVGTFCLAPFEDVWYRAVVTQIEEGSNVRVRFIDYGNELVIAFKCLSDLVEFHQPDIVYKAPGMAYPCTLYGVLFKPPIDETMVDNYKKAQTILDTALSPSDESIISLAKFGHRNADGLYPVKIFVPYSNSDEKDKKEVDLVERLLQTKLVDRFSYHDVPNPPLDSIIYTDDDGREYLNGTLLHLDTRHCKAYIQPVEYDMDYLRLYEMLHQLTEDKLFLTLREQKLGLLLIKGMTYPPDGYHRAIDCGDFYTLVDIGITLKKSDVDEPFYMLKHHGSDEAFIMHTTHRLAFKFQVTQKHLNELISIVKKEDFVNNPKVFRWYKGIGGWFMEKIEEFANFELPQPLETSQLSSSQSAKTNKPSLSLLFEASHPSPSRPTEASPASSSQPNKRRVLTLWAEQSQEKQEATRIDPSTQTEASTSQFASILQDPG